METGRRPGRGRSEERLSPSYRAFELARIVSGEDARQITKPALSNVHGPYRPLKAVCAQLSIPPDMFFTLKPFCRRMRVAI